MIHLMKNVLIVLTLLLLSNAALASNVEFSILHTNDLHSYFDGVMEKRNGKIIQRGVYSRLAYAIKTIRSQKLEDGEDFVMLLDAGDFYSGTLFHAMAPRDDFEDFPEYDFFRELNYDAVTLGNHEFDAKDPGFYTMMKKIFKRKNEVPVVSTNFNIPTDLRHVLKPSIIKEFKDPSGGVLLKVGFLGALGPNGCKVSKGMRQKLDFRGFDDKRNKERWNEIIKALADEAKRIKSEGAQVIVLMLHGGGEEDEKIAKEVPLIDVIISGHTHEVYSKKVGRTVISQAGHYGKYLGVLPFRWNGSELTLRKSINDPTLTVDIDDSLPNDPEVAAQIQDYQKSIDEILKSEGLPKSTDVAFRSQVNLPKEFIFNSKLGSFITSKVRDSLKDHDESIDLYFTTLGLIRSGLYSDLNYTTSEVFKIMPLGFGEKYQLGTPTVSFHLSKSEIKKLIEFLLIYSALDKKFMPVFSDSLDVEIRKWGIPFLNKISKLELHGKDYDEWPELIHVSTNAFVFKYISFVNEKSFGIVKLIPKDKRGHRLKEVPKYKGEFPELLNGLLKAAL